jgi:hypothetical protein
MKGNADKIAPKTIAYKGIYIRGSALLSVVNVQGRYITALP